MMRRPTLALLLAMLPVGASAQGLPIDFGADAAEAVGYEGAARGTAPSAALRDEQAASVSRARAVRHGEHTVLLIGGSGRSESTGAITVHVRDKGLRE